MPHGIDRVQHAPEEQKTKTKQFMEERRDVIQAYKLGQMKNDS